MQNRQQAGLPGGLGTVYKKEVRTLAKITVCPRHGRFWGGSGAGRHWLL